MHKVGHLRFRDQLFTLYCYIYTTACICIPIKIHIQQTQYVGIYIYIVIIYKKIYICKHRAETRTDITIMFFFFRLQTRKVLKLKKKIHHLYCRRYTHYIVNRYRTDLPPRCPRFRIKCSSTRIHKVNHIEVYNTVKIYIYIEEKIYMYNNN